jgi:hypothetical protein
MMKIPKICHGELGVKGLGDASKKPSRRGCQNDVVDVEQQVGDVGALFVNKEGCIGDRSREASLLHEAREALVPRPGRLLEPIQGLLQETDVIGGSRVNKSRRLLAVDCLVEMTVEEGVLHVQLMDRPGTGDGDAENNPDGGRFDDRTERLVVVDAVSLRKPSNDPPGLMACQGAVSMALVLEDPLAGDDVGARRARNETPGAIVDECLVLISHRGTPIRIRERGASVGRQWRRRGDRGEAVALHGRWQGACL